MNVAMKQTTLTGFGKWGEDDSEGAVPGGMDKIIAGAELAAAMQAAYRSLGYLLQQWPKRIRYIEDGRIAIDTNLAGNAIRPFSRGRRNWLFGDTVNGAKASASLCSPVQTARANELGRYAYLRRLFAELPAAQSVADFEALRPWNITSDKWQGVWEMHRLQPIRRSARVAGDRRFASNGCCGSISCSCGSTYPTR
jgi:Transposase IS66 family/IS66 C-terminal element